MKQISLENTKKIKLMDRVEDKYICTPEQLSIIFELIGDSYYITEDNGVTSLPYHSVYFDTSTYDAYNAQLNKEEHRQKIRIREYSDGFKFLEIKDKVKNIKTKKIRIPVTSYFLDNETQWIDENCIYDTKDLHKILGIKYNRITLVNTDYNERVTIDSNIRFYNYSTKINKSIKEIVIEVKHQENKDSLMTNILTSLGIEKQGFSKYKIGIESTQ